MEVVVGTEVNKKGRNMTAIMYVAVCNSEIQNNPKKFDIILAKFNKEAQSA